MARINRAGVDMRRLRCFFAVCEHGGFSRAADAIGIAQPALNRQVQLLKQEIEAAPFARNGRSAVPTEAGQLLMRARRRFCPNGWCWWRGAGRAAMPRSCPIMRWPRMPRRALFDPADRRPGHGAHHRTFAPGHGCAGSGRWSTRRSARPHRRPRRGYPPHPAGDPGQRPHGGALLAL